MDPLERHNISSNDRQRMIDWMIQVFRVLRVSSENSIFISVALMDRYFSLCINVYDRSSLLLVGLTCLFISSKYEETHGIFMEEIPKNAGHNQFQKCEILEMEIEILRTVDFKI